MRDLIFVVKLDGSYELTPTKNLRAQENYANSFVVITNKVGVVKLNIKLLSRTDRVLSQFMIPTLESPVDFIGDRAFFQDYANAKVYRIALDQSFLEEISMSFKGEVEVSFDFLRLVSDPRAITFKGDLLEGEELPETATEGDYFVIKTSSYTLGTITFSYGQTAIWTTEWVKGGAYKVIGTTLTHKMNVEQTLIGQQPKFDIAEESELFEQLAIVSTELADTYRKDEVYTKTEVDLLNDEQDLVIGENASDITALEGEIADIKDGTTIVKKAEQDSGGRVIENTYANKIRVEVGIYSDRRVLNFYLQNPNQSKPWDFISVSNVIISHATHVEAGLMTASDKIAHDSMVVNKENKSEKGAINGYAPLDENAKVPLINIPDSILGQLEYKGVFNPNGGYPSNPEKGWFYISTNNAIISGVDFKIGDWAVYNGTNWDKVDNTDAVASVNGKLGVVVINGTEILVGNGDTFTIEQRIFSMLGDIANRYTKAQTYSRAEVDNLLDQLKAIYGWEDSFLGELEHNDDLSRNILYNYDFIVLELFSGSEASHETLIDTRIVKPADLVINNLIGEDNFFLSLHLKPALTKFIYLQKDNIDTGRKLKVYGIKMEQQKAENIATSFTTTNYLNGKVNQQEVNIELDTQIKDVNDKVDLTNIRQDIRINEIEELARKSASGETSDNVLGTDIIPLKKNTANAPMSVKVDGGILEAPNLVVNGDFSNGTTDWYLTQTYASWTVENGTAKGQITTAGGTGTNINIYKSFASLTPVVGKTYYASFKVKSNVNTAKCYFEFGKQNAANTTVTTSWQRCSNAYTADNSNVYLMFYFSANYDIGNIYYLDDVLLYDIDKFKNKGVKNDNGIPFANLTNAQIKTQLDLWISKGILPNDNLLSVNMNKRVRSVSSDTLTTSDLYLQANTKGYSLPNGVKDTIEYRNGKYYFVQRVGVKVIQDADVTKQLVGTYTNIEYYQIPKPTDYVDFGFAVEATNILAKGFITAIIGGVWDDALKIGYVLHTATLNRIWFGFTPTTTLAQARTALAGTDIYYQLATPIETEIEAWGNLQGYESGIVYVDDIKIDASIYNSGITTTSEIKALDEIVKITNGVETQIDTSQAVIAVDKLSFTHPDLVDGDYVWFAYEENGDYYKAITNITYYIDKLVRTSPDGSVWKLDWSVSNAGVITWTPTKI